MSFAGAMNFGGVVLASLCARLRAIASSVCVGLSVVCRECGCVRSCWRSLMPRMKVSIVFLSFG
jgi:hypothetical protein